MIIHHSRLPDVEIPVTPLTGHVLAKGLATPDRVAMIDGPSGQQMTFGELDDAIHRLAGGLVASGLQPGDVVALMAPNMAEYAIAFHGIAVAGGTVTTLNPAYTAAELHHQLVDSAATRMITVADAREVATQACLDTAVSSVDIIGEASFDALFGDRIAQVEVDPLDHVVVLPYSSGTTGLPKGVMLTHHNLVANIEQHTHAFVYDDHEVAFAALPFFHIYGMQVLMNGFLRHGGTVVTVPRFDLAQALSLIQQHRVTHFYAVPPMVLALAKQPIVDDFDLSSLKMVCSGAAPLGAELTAQAEARVGCVFGQAYGMTELSPVTHATPPDDIRLGSAGLLLSNMSCRIVGEDGEDQPIGAEGEMLLKGPMVMKGYLNNEAATAETIDAEGWLHTGDVARIDEAGHTYVVDRVKELIKFKGFQVAPAELEALLLTHPAVGDAAVIGVPDDEAGELPKAFIVLKPDHDATVDELMSFVADQVASYKQIRMVQFSDEIPKSASGKILRRFLRDSS